MIKKTDEMIKLENEKSLKKRLIEETVKKIILNWINPLHLNVF